MASDGREGREGKGREGEKASGEEVGKRVDGLERGGPGGRQRLSAGRYHR